MYDDKLVIPFNYKDGTKTITFSDLQDPINNKRGLDLDCLSKATGSLISEAACLTTSYDTALPGIGAVRKEEKNPGIIVLTFIL